MKEDQSSQLYNELNKAWKATCRILFGEELGELREYEGWLKQYSLPGRKRKSHVSGKEVTLHSDAYCSDANFVSLDEVKETTVPININEIKDIDCLLEAISEKWSYTGNIILGRSTSIEGSTLVNDSDHVIDSIDVKKSSYIAHCCYVRDSKYLFGCVAPTSGEFGINAWRFTNMKRCFECHLAVNISDSYFCSNCENCQEMLFSFNQKGKRYHLGNLELPKDKYFQLKKKLVEEIKEGVKKNKFFPSLFQIIPDKRPEGVGLHIEEEKEGSISPMERAFLLTSRVLFKRELGPLTECENWLKRYVPVSAPIKSPFGHNTCLPKKEAIPPYADLPQNRIVSPEEAVQVGKLRLDEGEITSLERIKESLHKIAYLNLDFRGGRNNNIIQSYTFLDVVNAYKTERCESSENIAICYLSGFNKNLFGSVYCDYSQFAMRCFNSSYLNRCFEMEASTNCSDSCFCHNCEALSEAMFCFNVKGKRHAIGNTELPPEQYRKIKDTLVSQMADEIIRTKNLRYDIFNVGCGHR